MKKIALILLILALIIGGLGIYMILTNERDPKDIEGWGALAREEMGLIPIGLAILLAASSVAIFIDRLCLSKKRKGNYKK